MNAPSQTRPRRDDGTYRTPGLSLDKPLDEPVRGSGHPSLDAAMVGLLVLLVICHIAAAMLAAGWRTAALTDLLGTLYLIMVAARAAWRRLATRLMLFGLVAGVLELATDAAGERVVHSLSYPAGEPLLWSSPLYMPLSWMLVLALLAYLAERLRGLAPRLPLWGAMTLAGLAGAVLVPFFEETAESAGWWRYTPTRLMLGQVPAYVLVFEGLVAAALPLLVARLPELSWRSTALRGMALGLWMPVAALAAWLALGRW